MHQIDSFINLFHSSTSIPTLDYVISSMSRAEVGMVRAPIILTRLFLALDRLRATVYSYCSDCHLSFFISPPTRSPPCFPSLPGSNGVFQRVLPRRINAIASTKIGLMLDSERLWGLAGLPSWMRLLALVAWISLLTYLQILLPLVSCWRMDLSVWLCLDEPNIPTS